MRRYVVTSAYNKSYISWSNTGNYVGKMCSQKFHLRMRFTTRLNTFAHVWTCACAIAYLSWKGPCSVNVLLCLISSHLVSSIFYLVSMCLVFNFIYWSHKIVSKQYDKMQIFIISLAVKRKLSPRSGSLTLRQLNPIQKKEP